MARKIECNYAMMDTIAGKFSQQSDAIEQARNDLQRKVEELEGQWIGHGHDAFFQKMNVTVLPTMKRLIEAMREGHNVTNQIASLISDEEDEAAGAFRMTAT